MNTTARTALSTALLLTLAAVADGQGTATRTEVTRDGIRTVETGGAAAAPFAPWTTSGSNPNPSAAGLRWVYPNPAGMPWITESVSTGNHGTFHWLGQDLNFRRVSLVSSTDDQAPALPISEDPHANGTLFFL